MFWAFSRPSSGAQWLQWQPLVLPSYCGDSRPVFVVGPAGRPARPRTQHNCHCSNVLCLSLRGAGIWDNFRYIIFTNMITTLAVKCIGFRIYYCKFLEQKIGVDIKSTAKKYQTTCITILKYCLHILDTGPKIDTTQFRSDPPWGLSLLSYIYIYRFQNAFLRCPTPRLHCFLSSHWLSSRFLSFMAFLILSIQFFFWSSSCSLLFRHPLHCYFG
jgi:hypothetical protein